MPIYIYQCDTCGMQFERRQSMREQPLADCPECEGGVHRVVQPVGVVFRGSGFYVTDHRTSGGKASASESASKAADGKPVAGETKSD